MAHGMTSLTENWRGNYLIFVESVNGLMSQVKPVKGLLQSNIHGYGHCLDVMLQAMPGQNLSGVKRKAVTLLEAGASDLHSVDLKKKPEEEWSCSICQVSAPSEYSLNQHFQGKKHKAKEAFGQRAGGTGNNYAIGFCPKI